MFWTLVIKFWLRFSIKSSNFVISFNFLIRKNKINLHLLTDMILWQANNLWVKASHWITWWTLHSQARPCEPRKEFGCRLPLRKILSLLLLILKVVHVLANDSYWSHTGSSGMQSIERSAQEDALLVLFNAAISNLVGDAFYLILALTLWSLAGSVSK